MRGRARDDLALALGLAMGIAVVVGFGFAAQRESLSHANDFSAMWTGARSVLDGRDPYDPALWPDTMARYGTQRTHEDFFGYPPWVALALLPFGALPVGLAALAWSATGIAAAALGLRALLHVATPGLPAVHTLAGFTLLASQPGIATFWDGQWGFVLAGAVAVAVSGVMARRPRRLLAGTLMLAKPQLFVFAAWALVDALRARGDRAGLAWLVGGGAAVALAASLALPRWYGDWASGAFFGRIAGERAPTTLAAAATDLAGPAGAAIAAVAVLVVVAVALAFDRRSYASLAVWLALSSAATIYTWSYDHVLLVVPLIVATGVLARRGPGPALAFGAAGFAFLLLVPTALYVIADARENESFSAVVPACVLVGCALALWPCRGDTAAT